MWNRTKDFTADQNFKKFLSTPWEFEHSIMVKTVFVYFCNTDFLKH